MGPDDFLPRHHRGPTGGCWRTALVTNFHWPTRRRGAAPGARLHRDERTGKPMRSIVAVATSPPSTSRRESGSRALNSRARQHVASVPIVLRLSFDRPAAIVREQLGDALFIFHNRQRTHVKILTRDASGLWIHYKRLARGRDQRRAASRQGVVAADCAREGEQVTRGARAFQGPASGPSRNPYQATR